jgi:hypothetical protein
MAAAIASLTVRNQWLDQVYNVTGTVAISASPATYTTGGIALNMNQASVKASRPPESITLFSEGSSGYIYEYVKGTDNSNGLLKIFVQDAISGNPLAEMANSTVIPAGVSGDTIRANILWRGME